jgi:hypothetical protein
VPAHVLDPSLDNLRREFDAACQQSAFQARSEQLRTLNQVFRRFRTYQSESDWVHTMLDAASPYADYVAVFSIANQALRLRGQRPAGRLPDDLSFPVSAAAAFSSAIDAKDPVTTLRNPAEVSAPLSVGHAGERAHVFPVTNGDRVSAVLFASDPVSDMNALELVAGIASSVLERKANLALHAQIAAAAKLRKTMPAGITDLMVPVSAAPEPYRPEPARPEPARPEPARPEPSPAAPTVIASTPAPESKLPTWTDLPTEQRQLHIRAQRFARVAVAELQLARPEACRAGREQSDLYLFLKREIDKARESYSKQFMTVPSMVDYLHLELIQTAAQGDERKLGADYPGRLL